ncbi:transposase, Tc1-like protein [Tanacetum coccineum]
MVMEHSTSSCTKPNLSNSERQAIYESLLEKSIHGELIQGSIPEVARKFGVCDRTVSRIWHQAKLQILNGSMVNVTSKKVRAVGPKRVQINFNEVLNIPLRQRTNIRSLAKSLNVSKSTMHRRIKEGALRPHTNAIKPVLTNENKKTRLEFCLSMINPPLSIANPTFQDMFNVIHIDEKWFYMSKPSKRYYLVPGEEEPLRTCKSKTFLTKVMFLAAVARPRFDTSGNEIFSGKIGIFPLTTLEPAKRSSKNRVAGTLEIKPILSVTKDVTRSWLIQKVLPAIRARWPQGHMGPIYIQQDNAKPHIGVDDAEFLQEASRDGFDIRIRFQPPNSPDLNVLDLGFFRAIQSLQEQEVLGNINELVRAVETSFDRMSSHELNNVFLTLQMCMKEIMKVQGGNNYQTPHIGKARLERQGMLPLQISCDANLINQVVSYLAQ